MRKKKKTDPEDGAGFCWSAAGFDPRGSTHRG